MKLHQLLRRQALHVYTLHAAFLMFAVVAVFMQQQLMITDAAVITTTTTTSAFSITYMAKRRGKKNRLQKQLDDIDGKMQPKTRGELNQGRGQEITGVTLPAEGWEFGDGQRMACCNIENTFYAIQGNCPRCSFDLWKGNLLTDADVWGDVPGVACPTCSTTYSMRTGKVGPTMKRTGLAGFVGSLTQSATINDSSKNAKVFTITRDSEEDGGRVFCR